MSETLMTEQAATTTEGQAASDPADQQSATGADQSGEQQRTADTGDTKQAAADKVEGEQAKPEGAPDKYEFVAPEGSSLDPDVMSQFSEVAKELNLTQEGAQKVIDKIAPAMAQKQMAQFEAAKTAWADSAKADKEFGGDKLTENLAVAQKAMTTFGTPELRTLLNESGLGNHPEIIRAFYRAGKAISEDAFVAGGQGQSGPATVAQRMYPNMNP